MAHIEVEVRGEIPKAKFDELTNLFTCEGKFVERKERVLIDYSSALPEQGIEGRTLDIRLRSTNGNAEIVVKKGSWGGTDSRIESITKIADGEFSQAIHTFALIGYMRGMVCHVVNHVFEYQGIEFVLREQGPYFVVEAELLATNDEDALTARKRLQEVCAEIGIALFDDTAFYAFIEKVNTEVNYMYDFEKDGADYFRKRFNI
jgi:hypothetical protein